MKILTQTIVLFILVLFGCSKNKSNLEFDEWPNNIKDLIDSAYVNRFTLVNGDIGQSIRFLDSLNKFKKTHNEVSKEDLVLITDSIAEFFRSINKQGVQQVGDAEYISFEQITHSKDLAVRAFLESGLEDSISLENFREYVLPYKLTNEIFDDWRDSLYAFHKDLVLKNPVLKNLDSLIEYHRSHTYYSLSSKKVFIDYFPSDSNYSWLNFTEEGECTARCRYVIYHLRAAGIPATFDYLPNWGNRSFAAHAYVGLAHKKSQVRSKLLNDNNDTNLVDNLNAAINPKNLHVFQEGELPDKLYVQYEKTIPKIYRQTWDLQPDIIEAISGVPKDEIYLGLIKPNMIDVTAQYMDVGRVNVHTDFFHKNKLSYLATFDVKGWTPVAFSPFNWYGEAVFKDLGKNIMYLPMVYNGELRAIGNPFVLNGLGLKEEFICNKNELVDMKIIRKYPLFTNTANHTIGFKGSRIEGMNSLDKDEPVKILQTIDYYPFGMQEINLSKIDTLRYIQFKAPDNDKIRIAEIECFQDSLGTLKKLEDVNFKKGLLEKKYCQPFDGDQNTHRSYKTLRIDFGSPRPISKIRFCARSDSNYIIPGNEYELFYWDNGWVSKGVKVAIDNYLKYKNMPSGTIYWLRCLTEGKEERIFTYENGKQIWW